MCTRKLIARDDRQVCHHSLALLNQGGSLTHPSTPNFWWMNQGTVAPGLSEQVVTWNTTRSDFLPVVSLISTAGQVPGQTAMKHPDSFSKDERIPWDFKNPVGLLPWL